jgi:hypothetical protein
VSCTPAQIYVGASVATDAVAAVTVVESTDDGAAAGSSKLLGSVADVQEQAAASLQGQGHEVGSSSSSRNKTSAALTAFWLHDVVCCQTQAVRCRVHGCEQLPALLVVS